MSKQEPSILPTPTQISSCIPHYLGKWQHSIWLLRLKLYRHFPFFSLTSYIKSMSKSVVSIFRLNPESDYFSILLPLPPSSLIYMTVALNCSLCFQSCPDDSLHSHQSDLAQNSSQVWSLLLKTLQWLPIKLWLKSKVLTMAYNAFHLCSPASHHPPITSPALIYLPAAPLAFLLCPEHANLIPASEPCTYCPFCQNTTLLNICLANYVISSRFWSNVTSSEKTLLAHL